MEVVRILSIFSVVLVSNVVAMGMHPMQPQIAVARCSELQLHPNFDVDLVVGVPWRVFYTWELRYDSKCVDLAFKNATKAIISRLRNDMESKLMIQPRWNEASMLVWMGDVNHEMLLFSDQIPGKFDGVANFARKNGHLLQKYKAPLNRYFLKLLPNRKYMLWTDCIINVAMLLVRTPHVPFRADIASVASSLNLGDGFHACTDIENTKENSLMNTKLNKF